MTRSIMSLISLQSQLWNLNCKSAVLCAAINGVAKSYCAGSPLDS